MHKNWIKFITQVNEEIERLNLPVIYFRGHSNEKYQLLPSLLRIKNEDIGYLEGALYYDFVSMAGAAIKNESSWDILFTMRHHGVPTRLLDWTTSFAHALYFALSEKKLIKPHIWILDPYELSEMNQNLSKGLLNPNYDIEDDYVKLFVNPFDHPKVHRPLYPLSLYPARNNPRIFAQHGVFTMHGTDIKSLDTLAPHCLKKIYIPLDCIADAKNFLELAGINEYTVYPDFTGLANYLKTRHNI